MDENAPPVLSKADSFLSKLEKVEAGEPVGEPEDESAGDKQKKPKGKKGKMARAATKGEGVLGSRPSPRSTGKKSKGGDVPEADKAEMKRIIDEALSQTPEGYQRAVATKVTIKGGVKLTTIEITDTAPNGKVTIKTQKLGTKAGMKGATDGKTLGAAA